MSIPNCTTAGHEWRYRQGEEPECKHCLRGSLDIIDDLTAERDRLREALEKALAAIDRDRSGLASGLEQVVSRLRSGWWITEGRGSYQWDDQRYRDETRLVLEAVSKIAKEALRNSGTLADSEYKAARAVLSTPAPGEPAPAGSRMASTLEKYKRGLPRLAACAATRSRQTRRTR